MSSSRTCSGFFQIVLGMGILAAGGTLFYQKLKYGGPEKLSLKYTCESFRAIKEAQSVRQEQSVKLEKVLKLQLLQAQVELENRRSFRESAAAVSELHNLYASEQLAALKYADAELLKLRAMRKICADTGVLPKYVTALKDTASAVDPLRKSLAATAKLSSYKGVGESVFNRIGSAFGGLHDSVSNMHLALSNAGTTLDAAGHINRTELLPALDKAIAALEEEIQFRKNAAAAAKARAAAINRICAAEDLRNNAAHLTAAAQELDQYLKKSAAEKLSGDKKKLSAALLEKSVGTLQKAISEAEKNKSAFQSRYPGHSAASYDRVLSDLKTKLAAAKKNISEMELLHNAQDAISKASQRLAKIAELNKTMTFAAYCEMLLWLFAGLGFIANGLRCRREDKTLQ